MNRVDEAEVEQAVARQQQAGPSTVEVAVVGIETKNIVKSLTHWEKGKLREERARRSVLELITNENQNSWKMKLTKEIIKNLGGIESSRLKEKVNVPSDLMIMKCYDIKWRQRPESGMLVLDIYAAIMHMRIIFL